MASSKYINVPNGFEKEVEYFDQQSNKGAYLWGLVREDMQKKKEDEKLVEMMRSFLDKFSPSQIETIIQSNDVAYINDKSNISNNTRETLDKGKKRNALELISQGQK